MTYFVENDPADLGDYEGQFFDSMRKACEWAKSMAKASGLEMKVYKLTEMALYKPPLGSTRR